MAERAKAFSHSINIGGRIITFLFEPVFMIERVKYLVAASDGLQKNSLFYMEKNHLGWKIINAPQVGEKFLRLEEVLANLIEKNSEQ